MIKQWSAAALLACVLLCTIHNFNTCAANPQNRPVKTKRTNLAANNKTITSGNLLTDAGEPAPELTGGVGWLNCDKPIYLKNLRGKVVLLDFWTFCCINCMHVIPDLKSWKQNTQTN